MHEEKKSIKYWSSQDQPREKLLAKGALALSDSELIAILLGTGIKDLSAIDLGRKLLQHVNNDLNALAALSHHELNKLKGIGPAKAMAIQAALELGRRRQYVQADPRKKITTSDDAAILFNSLRESRQEEFWIACLNSKSVLIHLAQIHIGGISSVAADPRIIFSLALEHHAVSLVIAHNHPSGNLRPSKEDESITLKLKAAGALLDIRLADHLIITKEGFFSFADEGMI